MDSPILLPLDTSSCVYVEITLGLLCKFGVQSLTGLKLILLGDIDSRVPSLPICIPSIELTRLNDIVAKQTGYYDERALDDRSALPVGVFFFLTGQDDLRDPIGVENLDEKKVRRTDKSRFQEG